MLASDLVRQIQKFSVAYCKHYENTLNEFSTFSFLANHFYKVFSQRLNEGLETHLSDVFRMAGDKIPLLMEAGKEGEWGCYIPEERYMFLPQLEKELPELGYEHAYEDGAELVWLTNPGVPFRDFLKNHVSNNMIPHFFGDKSKRVTYHTEALDLKTFEGIDPFFVAHVVVKDALEGFSFAGPQPLRSDQYVTYVTHETLGIVGAYHLQKFLDGNIWGGNMYIDSREELKPYSLALGLHLAVIRDFPNSPAFEFGVNLDHSQNDYKRKIKGLQSSISYMWKEKV